VLRFGDVVSLTRGIEPDAHDAIRGGVVEELFGLLPIGLRLFGLTVASQTDAEDGAYDEDPENDRPDDTHGLPTQTS
jgi:hypothetical protein